MGKGAIKRGVADLGHQMDSETSAECEAFTIISSSDKPMFLVEVEKTHEHRTSPINSGQGPPPRKCPLCPSRESLCQTLSGVIYNQGIFKNTFWVPLPKV